MVAILLSLCCFVGCPLLTGVMWLLTRDREGARREREVRRLNAEAEDHRKARSVSGAPVASGDDRSTLVTTSPSHASGGSSG